MSNQAIGADPALPAHATALTKSGSSSLSEFARGLKSRAASREGVSTVVGAGIGAILGRRYGHSWLGAGAGAAIGWNAPNLLNQIERRNALCNIGQVGAGVVGARVFKGHPTAGFVIGLVLGGVALRYGGLRG